MLSRLLSLALLLACSLLAAGQNTVIIGLGGRQCNALGSRNLDGALVLSGDQNLQNSPQDCCASCKGKADCNIWSFCSAPEGCDDGGRYKQCWLRQDWNVWQNPRTRSAGSNWISGYIATHCPAAYPDKLLFLQRVNFVALSSPCAVGNSCTQCMCQISKAISIAQSEKLDGGLCLTNFRTALMFPQELGGAALSDAAMQRLSQCPVADPPCQDQKSSTVFGTWPLVVPSFLGNDVGAGCQNVDPATCAKLCTQNPSCNAFAYHPFLAGGTCCMKKDPSTDKQLDPSGWQMYWELPAGTTAEDDFFQAWNPWNSGGNGGSQSSQTLANLLSQVQNAPLAATTNSTPTIISPTSTANSAAICTNVAPPGGYTCQQQASWGKCGEAWMKSYCNESCGRCGSPALPACTCSDVNPNQYLCADEARWGKCQNDFMTKSTPELPEGYCQLSCGRCSCELVTRCNCTDVPPTPWYSCKQQKSWGKCSDAFMRGDSKHPEGYCQVTCGRCGENC